jgi:hypothetical protein
MAEASPGSGTFPEGIDDHAAWVSIGLRCVRDGILGVYADWKIYSRRCTCSAGSDPLEALWRNAFEGVADDRAIGDERSVRRIEPLPRDVSGSEVRDCCIRMAANGRNPWRDGCHRS